MIFRTMKTTLIIDDGLMANIKSFAAQQRVSLSRMVETLLRKGLRDEISKPKKLRPLPSFKCGEPKIDITNRVALYDFFDKEPR